jgi:hypothetical protein
VDFGAGGPLRKRHIQNKRLRKVKKRAPKLRWLARLSNRAGEIARSGAGPQLTFGAKIIGLPPRAMYLRRRMQAAASRIQASGSSLTAKLALGGVGWKESDPMVLEVAPPFGTIAALAWDQPKVRGDIADAWRQARDDMVGSSKKQRWAAVRGPVSAAFAHLLDVEVEWLAPFRIRALGQDICLLTTPPPVAIHQDPAGTRAASPGWAPH